MKKIKNTFYGFLIIMFLVGCQDNDKAQKPLDLSNMQLDFKGMNEDLTTFALPESSEDKRSMVKSLFKEVDFFLKQESAEFMSFDLTLNDNTIRISNVQKHTLDASIDPPEEFFGRCPDGYDLAKICYSRQCVEDTMVDEFEDFGNIGDCKDVRVRVGLTGASVCTKEC